MRIYLVGGAVRDELLGLPVQDRDWVVVGATPEALVAQGYVPVGKDFPVFLHPKTKEEYALARIEGKIGVGYTGFSCDASSEVSLEDDLMRRDLTINAIAMDDQGNIIKDATLQISTVTIDGIDVNQLFLEKCVYTHDFNSTQPETKDSFYGTAGCNGTIVFEFTTPIYLWLLEHM